MIDLDGWASHTDIFKSSPGLINNTFLSLSQMLLRVLFAVNYNYPLFMFGRILITLGLVLSVGGRNHNPSGANAEEKKMTT